MPAVKEEGGGGSVFLHYNFGKKGIKSMTRALPKKKKKNGGWASAALALSISKGRVKRGVFN